MSKKKDRKLTHMGKYAIIPVANGIILRRTDCNEVLPKNETFVFNQVDDLCNFINNNLRDFDEV